MEQSTLITLVLPYDYGHLGGGRAGDDKRFTDADNEAFLESLGVSVDQVEVVVLEENEVVQAAASIESAEAPAGELPKMPPTGFPAPDDGTNQPEKL